MPVKNTANPSINFSGIHLYTRMERGTVREKNQEPQPLYTT